GARGSSTGCCGTTRCRPPSPCSPSAGGRCSRSGCAGLSITPSSRTRLASSFCLRSWSPRSKAVSGCSAASWWSPRSRARTSSRSARSSGSYTFGAIPWARRLLAFLRREIHWAYSVVMSFVVALVGGRDDDRYLYVLVPALAVFVFHLAPSSLWRSAWRVGALTVLHLAAVRFLWPVGTSESEYLQYTVSAMSVDR